MEQGDKGAGCPRVLEHSHEYPSKWAAITIVAERLGMSPESLRRWIRQYQLDAGRGEGITTKEAEKIYASRYKNAELELRSRS